MTVEEVLKQSGLNDEQIKALDAKAMGAFTTVLKTATDAEAKAKADRDAAELAQRAQNDMYANEIAPSLDKWANESAALKAEVAFYKTQAEQAKAGGFIPKDAPGYTPNANTGDPARGNDGRFVPNANPVPGSPAYMTPTQGIQALSNAHWLTREHFRLFGSPEPDDFDKLLQESVANHMEFRPYVEKKYGFDGKRKEIAEAQAKKERDAIVKETEDRIRKEYAERGGSNPNLNRGFDSQFSKISKAVTDGQRKDPLSMTREQRREHTRQNIQRDIAENETAGVR